MKWLTEKPEFKKDCILLTASNISDEWYYTLYTIQKTEVDGQWYWRIFCEDGEEWGDLADLHAQLYCKLPMIKT